jgi:hypothetical protein
VCFTFYDLQAHISHKSFDPRARVSHDGQVGGVAKLSAIEDGAAGMDGALLHHLVTLRKARTVAHHDIYCFGRLMHHMTTGREPRTATIAAMPASACASEVRCQAPATFGTAMRICIITSLTLLLLLLLLLSALHGTAHLLRLSSSLIQYGAIFAAH